MRILGTALGAGLLAGSLVGAVEALYVLQSTTPSEYQAFGYAWTLYGLIGGGMGFGLGLVLAVLGRKLSSAMVWCLSFAGVVLPLGLVIGRYIMNKALYAEQGVPLTGTAALGGGLLVSAVLGVWIGQNLLEKTPLRMLASAKGTVVAWGGGLLLAWVLAMSPAPGAAANMKPDRAVRPELAGKPDVIVVLIDTLRADALGAYGAGPTASPKLDAFAAEGVVFEQYITSASWTRASTASMLTSLAPSSHTCEQKNSALPQAVVTLAEEMSEAGYVTGGLPNNANVTGAQGFGQGFDWFPYEPEYPLAARESTYALSMYSVARKVYAKVNSKKRVEDYYTPAEKHLVRAHEFLEANQGRPSFLFVHLMEPHDPYFEHPYSGVAYGRAEYPEPPADWADKLRGLYAGEVTWVDAQLGEFFAKLKAEGRYDNSLIIVTADHGEEFLEHGGWWHGTTLYDEQIRVPLIVKLPQGRFAGSRVPWQVRQIDVAPTVVDAAGRDPHVTWQGAELFPDSFEGDLALSTPPPPAEPAGEAAPTEPQGEGAPVVPEWKAPDWTNHPASREALAEQDFEGYDLQALRRNGRKLIEALRVPAGNARNQAPVQYYDLVTDPGEKANLGGSGSSEEAADRAALSAMVEDRKGKSVGAETHEIDAAERARLCSLGYLSGSDCEDGAPAPE